jgi:hypothetical protein
MIGRIGFALLILTMIAGAQPASAAGKIIKEEKGRCQAVVPDDALVALPFMAQGPNGSYSVSIDHDGEKFKILTSADLQQLHYSKAIENTANRQVVEKESHAVTQGFRAFHVYLPTKEGRCHVGISFKTTVPEDLMKGIATSATLTK